MEYFERMYKLIKALNMEIKEITGNLSNHSYKTPKDIWNLFISIEKHFAIKSNFGQGYYFV